MPYKTKLISKKTFNDAVAELESLGKTGKLAIRLQSIISSKNSNISTTAQVLGFTRASLIKWVKRFSENGLLGLEDKNGRGRKSIITAEIKSELKNLLESNSDITLKKLRSELKKKFNINLSKTTIHRQVKNFGYLNFTIKKHRKKDIKLVELKKSKAK